MAHQGLAGSALPPGHHVRAAEASQISDHPHGSHEAGAASHSGTDVAGAPADAADPHAWPCTSCPLCLALVTAWPALDTPERMSWADSAQDDRLGRHPDPDIPPPR